MSAPPPNPPSPSDRSPALTRRAADGAVLLTDGRRGAGWPEPALQELHRRLTLENPDAAQQLIYRVGFEWGLQDFLQFSVQVRDGTGSEPGEGVWALDTATALERWSAPLIAAGWGKWEFDFAANDGGVTVVELQASAVASALASPSAAANDPVCHLYAGLFAGALSFYHRTELHAVETECAAMGYPCCRFLVAPGPLVDRVETARRGGASHAAIARGAVAPASGSSSAVAKVAKDSRKN